MAPPTSSIELRQLQLVAADRPIRRRLKKYRSIEEIMRLTERVVAEDEMRRDDVEYYNSMTCHECGSGERGDEMLLCDKCDKGYHMICARPIVTRIPIGPWFCAACSAADLGIPLQYFTPQKIAEFFNIHKCLEFPQICASPRDAKKRRRRSSTLVIRKRQRRMLPYIASEDPARRLAQMRSLACALMNNGMEFSNELTYMPHMAPRSANQAILESGAMQILSKEDTNTLEVCAAMHRRGEYPPLLVTFDSRQGYTVEADGPIKGFTLLGEYTGDVDYMRNRVHDDCDSLMTLLLATDETKNLLICPDRRANIARFFSGINNHTREGRKKQNTKTVRYNVNGECRVLLVASRDIGKGERLCFDYNGHEHEYPTHNFV